jgi:hypothetical protein
MATTDRLWEMALLTRAVFLPKAVVHHRESIVLLI